MSPDSSLDPAFDDELRRLEAKVGEGFETRAFARLADGYRKAGALERALEVVEEGLLRHPEYLSAHIVRARTLRQLGREEGSVAAFHRVLDLDPDNLVALRAVAEMAERRGDLERARRWYARLAEVDPLDEEVRMAMERLGAEDEGTDTEDERAGPQDEGAGAEDEGAGAEVEAAGTQEAPQAAEEVRTTGKVEQVEEAEPSLDTLTMAELYMRQGLFEEAERVYARLLRFRPGDERIRAKLHEVRVRIGHPDAEAVAGPVERGLEEDADAGPGETVAAASPEAPFPPAADGGEPSAAGRAPSGAVAGGGPTIRRYLRALLEGRATEEAAPTPPRPSAFDAWLERGAGRALVR